MKAVVFDGTGEVLADVAEPELEPGHLLLKTAFCGICGSDLHASQPDYQPGVVMGHEFSATVLEVGTGVTGWNAGDRVCVNPNAGFCGQCASCRSGFPNRCTHIWEHVIGLSKPGALAPVLSVPAYMVHRLPDSVSLAAGAWVEPLAVALRAVRRSGARLGDAAVVFGAGPIGLLITTLLKASGLNHVTVVEPSKERRATAHALGADHTINPQEIDPVLHLHQQGAPAFAFECTGVAAVTSTAVAALRPGGRLTVSGFARQPPSYRAADLLMKEIEIVGSYIYVQEFEAALGLMAAGSVDIRPLTSGVIPLTDAQHAFHEMRTSPSSVKYLITPD